MRRELSRGVFAALAFGLPLALVPLHATLGHAGDVAFFDAWCAAVRDGAGFYRDGPGVNYPIVGVGLVCAPEALGDLSVEAYRLALKGTLALAEGLATWWLARLGERLGLRRPRAMALLVWAVAVAPGGAFFGQIDVWGTLWMTVMWAVVVKRAGAGTGTGTSTQTEIETETEAKAEAEIETEAGAMRGTAAAGWALPMFGVALLTKQLALFSAPTLALALASRPPPRRALVVGLLATLALLFAPDLFLVLPEGFHAHLVFVLFGGGSDHGATLAHHGASLWALFAPDAAAPAASIRLAGLDARALGWVAFAGAQVVLACRLARARFAPRALVLHAGATHLAMAVLLTGVHERYLAHGGPWLLLALAGSRRFLLALGTVAATGVYVVASVAWEAFPPWLREADLAGTLQLWLLVSLLVLPFPRAR